MHKVFISYHHQKDQWYKDYLVGIAYQCGIFIDASVDTGNISDQQLSDEQIRRTIRDEYLRDSTVTIVLAGTETEKRKHVDWEIYSSMYDGAINKKSGMLVINLPDACSSGFILAPHEKEEKNLYPDIALWTSIRSREEYECLCPSMPDRLIDNFLTPTVKISVTPWNRICSDAAVLRYLIELAYRDRNSCQYDLSRLMRRNNS